MIRRRQEPLTEEQMRENRQRFREGRAKERAEVNAMLDTRRNNTVIEIAKAAVRSHELQRQQQERYAQQVRETNARVPHPPGPLPPYPPRDADGNIIPKPEPPLPDPLPYLPLPQTAPTILGPSTTPIAKELGLPASSSTPPVYVPTQQQLDSGIEPDPSNPWGSAAPAAKGPMEHRQFVPRTVRHSQG